MKKNDNFVSDLRYNINKLQDENTIQWKKVSVLPGGSAEARDCAGYERALEDVLKLIDRFEYEEEEW